MNPVEAVLFAITVFIYALGSGLILFSLIFKQNKYDNLLGGLIKVGLVTNLATLVVRSLQLGYWPVRTVYEFNLVAGLLVAILALVIWTRFKDFSFILAIALPAALFTLGFGYATSPKIEQITAAYKSYWLVIHVFFALQAYACFVIATAGSIFFLLRRYKPNHSWVANRNLDMAKLDEFSFRFVLYGFAADTIMLISGALWAKMLWGRFWGWDPVETWSLISWLAYGTYVHLRLTLGWRGVRLAWICVAALAVNIISIWAVGMFTPNTYHSYEGIMRSFFN